MKKLIAITAITLFAASSFAWAGEGHDCGGFGATAEGATGPITTAMETGPSTPKPKTTKSGG